MSGDNAASAARAAFVSGEFARAEDCLGALSSANGQGRADPLCEYNAAVVRFYGTHKGRDATPLLVTALKLSGRADANESEPLGELLARVCQPQTTAQVRTTLGLVAIYNVGVIAYNRGFVAHAGTLARFLFSHVEAMDDWLAIRVCCLVIDSQLRSGDVEFVSRVVTYAERLTADGVSAGGGDGELASGASGSLAVTPEWDGAEASLVALPQSAGDLKFCMHLYAARLYAALDDSKAFRKEAKSAVTHSDEHGRSPTAGALMVKARMEPNAAKVLRIMESIHSQTRARERRALEPLALNNLGVILHRTSKHAAASVCFQRARMAFDELLPRGPPPQAHRPLSALATAADTHVAYNLALQYVVLGEFRAALGMFAACARSDEVFATSSPIVWLRMAECCARVATEQARPAAASLVRGRGRGRRHVLQPAPRADPALVRYGVVCARAALEILDRRASAAAPADEQLRCHALALIAHGTLDADPAACVAACNDLVERSRPGDSDHAVLGRLYGAEALCRLGRPNEASDRLAPLLAMSSTGLTTGREAAFVNAALVHDLRGDAAAAARAAKAAVKVTEACPPRHSPRIDAVQVSAYITLKDNNLDAARTQLRASAQV